MRRRRWKRRRRRRRKPRRRRPSLHSFSVVTVVLKDAQIDERYFTYLHILWFKQFCFSSEYPQYDSKIIN